MSHSVKTLDQITQDNTEKAKEEKQINEVLLLIKTLIYEEESTIKLIIESLYDIGAPNLVDQKIKLAILNHSLKFMTKLSKPVFKIVAWHWFKNNCPTLITGWLHSKVSFPKVEPQKIAAVIENENKDIDSSPPLLAGNYTDEIKHLHFQVKLLTGVLIVVLTMFSGSFIWINYSLQQSHLETVQKLKNKVKTLESSTTRHNNH
ncbi:MAG: hypothetical protein ACKO11_01310 [Cuspidothrix sp.]